jgi:hypothetical protein
MTLLQFYGPVCVVEELFPAFVTLVAGLLLAHAWSFSTNYPPSARFFTKPLQLSGNSGILLAGSRLN